MKRIDPTNAKPPIAFQMNETEAMDVLHNLQTMHDNDDSMLTATFNLMRMLEGYVKE